MIKAEVMKITLEMQCAMDFGLVPECGCPHEHWHIDNCCLDIHFEPDGQCHVLLYAEEDEEAETHFEGVTSIDQARPLAMAWALDALQPKENDQ
jgi:hypothetical protein